MSPRIWRFPSGADAESDEDGAVENADGLADFFVAGIEDDVSKSAERAGALIGEVGVELSGAVAAVSRADGGAAKFLQNGGDFASGHALHVHFGQGQSKSLFATRTALQSGGIKVDVDADLRDSKSDGPESARKGLRFEAIGVASVSL